MFKICLRGLIFRTLAIIAPAIILAQPGGAVTVSTTALPASVIGTPYSATLTASGGLAPYSGWALASGSLPTGLTLNAATGVISGTPSTFTGNPFSFTVTVNDSTPSTSPSKALSISVTSPLTYPSQSEVLTTPRNAAAQPLLFSFATNQIGFDTEFTISNTSLDTQGSTALAGTCTVNYYGTSAPASQVSSSIAAGQQLTFTLSQGGGGITGAPGFQGYVIANCAFPLARGSARVFQPGIGSAGETAQVVTLPRSVPASQALLIPYATNAGGFDTGISIANTGSDPFGASGAGATATSGSCTLYMYGSGAPASPFTTPLISPGTVYSATVSGFAPGFSGYVIANCSFGTAAGYAYLLSGFNTTSEILLPVTPETLTLPRSSATRPLLFPAVTSQNGNDTGIAIANTSVDPFGASGATAQSGTCSLNFYGSGAPASSFTTPNIAAGSTYVNVLSALAPGFQGYITASCTFGSARGYSYVLPAVKLNSYSQIPEVSALPRTAGVSSLLFTSVLNQNANDTNITISNTSLDPFGTTAGSGTCTVSYFGSVTGGGSVPSPQTSANIIAGGQLNFSLSHGGGGLAGAPGFRGYIIADCGFPLARGIAEITGTPGGFLIVNGAPAGTLGTAYSATLKAANGVAPYQNWTVISGAPPPGLTLNASTGVIAGTPTTTTGSPFAFTVTVQDSNLLTSAAKSLSIAIAAPTPPVITGVTNSGSFAATPLAPGSLASVFGTLLANSTVNGNSFNPLSTALGGTSLTVNGVSAGVNFVSAGQINFQIPYGTATGSATVVVTNNGLISNSFPISIAPTGPGIFNIVNPDQSPNGASNPTPAGVTAAIYFTGAGIATPAVADRVGNPTSPLSIPNATTTVTVNGIAAAVSSVTLAPQCCQLPNYFYVTNGNAGIAVAKITVPAGLANGTYPVVITTGGVASAPANLVVGVPALAISSGGNLGSYTTGTQQIPLAASGGDFTYSWTVVSGTLPPGLALRTDVPSYFSATQQAGLIGVATVPGTYNFTLGVTSGGVLITKAETIRITVLNVLDQSINLPDAFIGQPYSYTFTAMSTGGPVTFAANGTLPAGLTLSSAGVLSGTPTATFSCCVNFSISDGTDTIFRGQSLNIYAVDITSPGALPNAVQNGVYNTTLTASGGTGPYTWTANCCGLPSGLSLNANGVISGTVTSGPGLSWFTVKATDVNGLSYTKTLSIDVTSTPVTLTRITLGYLNDPVVGNAYAFQVPMCCGGPAPFTWTATGLPPGMSIHSGSGVTSPYVGPGNAEIWGIPQAAGTYNITVTVTDANGAVASLVFPLHVSVLDQNPGLSNGIVNTAYSNTLRVLGGTGPYTATIVPNNVCCNNSSLPAGLTLNGANQQVAGTPLEGGNFNLYTLFTDSAGNFLNRQENFFIAGSATSYVSINSYYNLGQLSQGAAYSNQLSACCVASTTWTVVSGTLPPGIALSSAGLLSGSPTAAGDYTFLIKATDVAGVASPGFRNFIAHVTTTPISITTGSLPSVNIGSAYNQALAATGGTGTLTWTTALGSYLPPGITLAGNGVLSGTSTAQGQFFFNVIVTDAAGDTTNRGYTINVYSVTGPPLAMSFGTNLGTFTTGTQNIQLGGNNGNGVYTWSLVSGTLPTGLALRTDVPSYFSSNAQAGLLGVATTPGTYNFTLKLTSNGQSVTQTESIRITVLNVRDQSINLPDAFIGQPYSYAFTAMSTGGPVTFTANGTLPAGLTLSSAGVLSGTPTATFSCCLNFSVSDGTDTIFKSQSLNIYAVDITSPGALPNVAQNGVYSTTLTASGGTGPYTWTYICCGLPSGLSLSANGVISGTVNSGQGLSWFTVRATDVNGLSYSKTMSIDVTGAPAALTRITLGYLNDPVVGNAYAFQVTMCCGGTAPFTWTASGLPTGMSIRSGSGITSPYIGPGNAEIWGIPQAAGTYNITVTVTDANGAVASLVFPLHVSVLDQNTGLPNGTVNTAYTGSLRVLGGTGPYTATIVPNNNIAPLPVGLTLNGANQQVTGTPLEGGSFNPYILFADSAGNFLNRQENFFIAGSATSYVSINSFFNLGQLSQGSTYSNQLFACCVASTTWSLASGTLPPGITLSSAGLLSGSPTAAGDYSFLIKATDAAGVASPGLRNFIAHVTTTPIFISTGSLASVNFGSAYNQTLAATGGTGTLTWTTAMGNYLPPGITLAANGVLSGTSTAQGQFFFNVIVTDAAGDTTNRNYTINVYPVTGPPVSMNFGTNLGTYTMGTQNIQLGATGGNGVYTWSLVSGTLPTGLTLRTDIPSNFASNAQAGLLGVATTPGTYNFTLKVTSTGGNFTQAETIKITTLNVRDQSISLPDAFVSAPYSYAFTAIGSAGPVTFTATTSAGGIILSSAGVFSGTPTTPGFYTLNYSVSDGVDTTFRSQTFTVYAVNITSPGLLPNATQNSPYSYQLTASGGTGPYVWTAGCCLPAGLTLSSAGVISGTPTGTGMSSVNITATDSNHVSYTKNMSLDVVGVPVVQAQVYSSLSTYDPIVGDPYSWSVFAFNGGTAPFTWTATGLPPGMSIRWGAAITSPYLNGGQAEVWGIPQAAGNYNVQLTVTDANGAVSSQNFPMHVSALDSFSAPSITTGTINVPYSATLHPEGGTGPYTAVLLPNTILPDGITFDPATMVLSGTPLEAGVFTLYYRFKDAPGDTLTRSQGFVINGNGVTTISINTGANLGTNVVGSSPSIGLSACCIPSAYVWTLAGGTLPPGQTLSSGGVLSGTLTTSGTYTFLIKAADSTNAANYGFRQFVETVTPISITTSSLPYGDVGVAYNQALVATGGTGTLTWTLPYAYNGLPPGLTISTGGVISGTPTAAGLFFPLFLVTDSAGNTATRSYTLNIYAAGPPPLNLPFGPNLGSVLVGVRTYQLSPSGGTPPYHYSLTPGAQTIPGMRVIDGQPLPTNFTTSTGAWVGVIVAPGLYTTSIRVTDSLGVTFDRAVTLNVSDVAPLYQNTLPKAVVGTPYSFALTSYGGSGTYAWSGVSMPAGLSVSSSGQITGTPTAAGTFTFTVNMADAAAPSVTLGYIYTLVVNSFAITDSPVLPQPTSGLAYTYTLNAPACGTGCAWTMPSGSLPSGLTLSGAGVISGTTTNTGFNSTFTIQAAGSNGTVQKLFAMIVPATVISNPTITTAITTSNVVGGTVLTQLSGTGGIAPYTWSVQSGNLPPGVTLQGPGDNFGQNPGFYYLAGRAMVPGTYNFTVKIADSLNNSSTRTFSWVISRLAFSYTSLPASAGGVSNPLIVNTPYSQAMLIYGGTGTYSSFIPAAPVYPGLAVNAATGTVSGTPTNTGSVSTIWTVTDSTGNTLINNIAINASSNQTTNVSISGGPGLNSVFALGSLNTFVLTGSGGTGPYTITAPGGLPPGVALATGAGGVVGLAAGAYDLQVSPVTPGAYTFTLQIADVNGVVGARTYSIIIPGFSTPITAMPIGATGVPYSQSLFLFSNTTGATWGLAAGSAYPPGLTLSAAGVLSGTPTAPGAYSFVATLGDGTNSTNFTISVTISGIAITTPLNLPVANFNAYTAASPLVTMAATGGTAALTWSATGLPSGLTISPTGQIIGTATATGRFAPTITVTDGTSTTSQLFTLYTHLGIPTELDFTITSATLQDEVVGHIYNTIITPNGGLPPYTWAVAAGSTLPPGLRLISGSALPPNAAPGLTEIAGSPSTPGQYSFDLTATDSAGASVTRTFTLNVTSINLLAGLGTATVGTPFTQQLTAFGGTAPYTFTIAPPPVFPASTLLPPGITMSASGLFSGTPTSTGSFPLTINVQDSAGHSFTTTPNFISNNSNGLRIASSNFATGVGNPEVNFGLTTSGTSTYAWSLVSGSLPTGVSMSSGGILSGWFSAVGVFNFTVQAVDNANSANVATRVLTYIVAPIRQVQPQASVFAAHRLPGGTIGVPYSFTFKMAGGQQPYTFATVSTNPLPAGLTLSSAGILSGTPTQSGVFGITANITDGGGAKFNWGGTLIVTPAGVNSPLEQNSLTMNDASLGVPFATELDRMVYGGTPPFTWTVNSGSTLPAGLAIVNGTNGLPSYLSGVPTTAGPVPSFTLRATDFAGQSRTVSITAMNVSPMSLAPGTLVSGRTGSFYSAAFSAAGGASPYHLQLAANSNLPPGMALVNGTFAGTPQYAGVYWLTFVLTDSSNPGNTLTRYYDWVVDDALGEAPAISITPNPINIFYQQGNADPSVPLAIASSSGSLPFSAGVFGFANASLSSAGGNTNAFPSLNISAASLGVGTYSGLLAVGSAQAVNGGDVVPFTLTVIAAPPCTYSLNPSSINIPIAGGTGSFSVATGAGCAWSAAVSDSTLITVTGPASGVGPATITYSVSANPTLNQRNGTITVGGQTYSIAQFGNTCSFGITPANMTTGPAGGVAPIQITASNSSCTWTAAGLGVLAGQVTPSSGTGSLQVSVTIPVNAAASNQVMTATIAGQTLTVNQTGAQCIVTLPGTSATALVSGGVGAVLVTIPAGCTYSTISGPSWITVTSGGSGTASGSLVYNVDPNSTTSNRSGFLTIGGVPYQITQPGIACSITLDTSPLGSPFAVGGGSGVININANGANCTWAATSGSPFASVSPSAGTGSGSVNVTVTSNAASTSSRTGSVSIAGQPVSFTQGGTTCSFSLRAPGALVSSSGGSSSVGVIAPSACSWTAVPDGSAPWLTIPSSGTGGTADVQFVVQASTSGTPRTATLTIAGLPFTVTEAAAPCSYTLASGSASLASPGITGATLAFTTAQSGCTTSGAAVTSYANWITVANTSAGAAGQLTYTVGVNPAGTTRKGDVQVGDQLFTVTQSGAACAYSLASYGAAFGQLGGPGSVRGSPSAVGCTPVAGTTQPSIVSLGALTGPTLNIFTQAYTVNAFNSLTNATRRATVTFGGQLYTIKQTSW